MPAPATPPKPKPAGSTPAPAINPDVDEQMHEFWRKNSQSILVFCGLVLLGYLGKVGWEYLGSQKQADLAKEFSQAATPDEQRAFAAAHPDQELGGVAAIEAADSAYSSGQIAEAEISYQTAATTLKAGPLAARARLGLAMCQIQSGHTTEGEAQLHQLADDTTQFTAIRAEAMYQLASLAASEGKGDEVRRIASQLMQVDPSGGWAQRAFALGTELPSTQAGQAPASSASGAPAVSFKIPEASQPK